MPSILDSGNRLSLPHPHLLDDPLRPSFPPAPRPSRASDHPMPIDAHSHPPHIAVGGYNLMVAGQRTGKTSFLRLLLDTSNISCAATKDQLASVAKFVQGCSGHTSHIRHASVNVDLEPDSSSSPPQTISMTLVDTPSLDSADESASDITLHEILRHVDSRYAEGLDDERRAQTGDSHIHLCIYFLDPDTIVPPSMSAPPPPLVNRPRASSFTRSEPEPVILEPPVPSHHPVLSRPTLPPQEVNIIRRLSSRVNVLPVIACADTLTNDRLAA
ncbi:hypothetical protein CONPUDRAFT_165291, partial [Coniophora puteana RWD-64-598 SS2]